MRYYLIAGEASGDLHAASLIKEIRALDQYPVIRAWAGDLSEKAGAKVVKHYRDLAFMGFAEVAANIRTILKNIKFCKDDIKRFQPDTLILVDYPGFNLRIAEWAKKQGFSVCYYISPQVWAWNTGRVHKIKKIVDQLFVILPFEKDFYQKYDMEVEYVGHPLMDVIPGYSAPEDFLEKNEFDPAKKLIALLPGSRKQEIKRMLPVMKGLVKRFPEKQFAIAGAPAVPAEFYRVILGDSSIPIIQDQTYSLLSVCDAAIVTSGTATLETALFRVPQVVCYSGNRLSYMLAKRLVKVPYIALVNLIVDEALVKELIQEDFNLNNLETTLKSLDEPETRKAFKVGYDKLFLRLGAPGASKRVANKIWEFLKEKNRPY